MKLNISFFNKILSLLLLLLMVFSCVPRKKLIYLQPDHSIRNSAYYYDPSEYVLKPEDEFALEIFSLTPGEFNFFSSGQAGGISFTNKFLIDRQGVSELPAVGEVEMAGFTVQEAEDKVQDLLQDYLKGPLVKITVETPFIYTILGAVNGEGRNTLPGEQLNIMEVIANSGGLTKFADRENIRIVRKNEGEINVLTVNVLDEQLLGDSLYHIQSEDIIIVDPLPARFWQDNVLYGLTTIVGLATTVSFFIFRFTR